MVFCSLAAPAHHLFFPQCGLARLSRLYSRQASVSVCLQSSLIHSGINTNPSFHTPWQTYGGLLMTKILKKQKTNLSFSQYTRFENEHLQMDESVSFKWIPIVFYSEWGITQMNSGVNSVLGFHAQGSGVLVIWHTGMYFGVILHCWADQTFCLHRPDFHFHQPYVSFVHYH